MMVSAAISKGLLAGVLCRFVVLLAVAQFAVRHIRADAIRVKEKKGTMYGFLVLKSAEGRVIGMGTQINTVEGNRVRSRTTFHFRDGSIDDEVSTFTQERVFQLVSDRHIQKGPSFPEPMDLSINAPAKTVSWREMKKAKAEPHTEHMDLPPDLANGMTSLIVQNFPVGAAELKVSYLAGTSKPRVVKLSAKAGWRGDVSSRRSNPPFKEVQDPRGNRRFGRCDRPVTWKAGFRCRDMGDGWRSCDVSQNGRSSLRKRANLDDAIGRTRLGRNDSTMNLVAPLFSGLS